MPSSTTVTFKPQHPTFVAEVEGVDWTKPLSPQVFEEIKAGIIKYGVLIFRDANINDDQQIAFASLFGELERSPAKALGISKSRIENDQIFDLANLDANNELIKSDNKVRNLFSKGNEVWHADMQYHPRRCLYSMLRAVEIPPAGTGGETLYADSRTAYDDLSQEMKDKLEDVMVNCSLLHNRRIGAPELYKGVDPFEWPISRWKAVYPHEGSGRKNLYLTTYAYSFDGMTPEESEPLIKELLAHITQDKYVHTVYWNNPGDMVMWDNSAVLHRATDGSGYRGKYRRDVRRTSVYDFGKYAWGGNDPENNWKAKLPADPFAAPTPKATS